MLAAAPGRVTETAAAHNGEANGGINRLAFSQPHRQRAVEGIPRAHRIHCFDGRTLARPNPHRICPSSPRPAYRGSDKA